MPETVDHPAHYGGGGNPYEAIRRQFMKHERRVKALREWTRRIQAENAKRADRRAYYLNHHSEYLAMSESEQFSDAGTCLRNRLFDCLREGIDQLPLPTVSDLTPRSRELAR